MADVEMLRSFGLIASVSADGKRVGWHEPLVLRRRVMECCTVEYCRCLFFFFCFG